MLYNFQIVSGRCIMNMDCKTGLLVLTLLVGCFAIPAPKNDMSEYFDREDRSLRIVGGNQAAAGSHPYMVGLTTGLMIRSYHCGASLVTRRTIVTAAHCIASLFSGGSLTSSLRATVGTNRWNSGGQHYNIARNITHPNYLTFDVKNDIGLLITSTVVRVSNVVQPVPISYAFIGQGVRTRLAGWGRTSASSGFSANLMEVVLNTIDGNQCARHIATVSHRPRVEPHLEICTLNGVGTGTCAGDSGGGLLRADNRQLIGVVSWGFPCARGLPDMFARVSAFQAWLTRSLVH